MSRTGKIYWRGVRNTLPFLLVIGPFGMLFGVVATEAGLDLVQTVSASALIIAGSAQFAAVQVLADNGPVLVAILTGIAVNLRMAMYSASIAPYLGKAPTWKKLIMAYVLIDQSYSVAHVTFEREPDWSTQDRFVYFLGSATMLAPPWYAFTLIGALLGSAIPPEYALDFALPITFIAIVAPLLRSLPHLAAAFVSVVVALPLTWMPYNLWLLVAAVLAMITGAKVEKMLEART